MARAYAEAMKCCHRVEPPPERDTGFALLTGRDVLTNRTGKRDAYLRAHVAEAASARASPVAPSAADHERDNQARDGVEQLVDGGREEAGAADEGAADVAAELEAQAAASADGYASSSRLQPPSGSARRRRRRARRGRLRQGQRRGRRGRRRDRRGRRRARRGCRCRPRTTTTTTTRRRRRRRRGRGREREL